MAPIASDKEVLILVGAYTIGKERVWLEAARALGEKVWLGKARRKVVECLGWDVHRMAVLADRQQDARIHVVPMGWLAAARLAQKLKGLRASFHGAASSASGAAQDSHAQAVENCKGKGVQGTLLGMFGGSKASAPASASGREERGP